MDPLDALRSKARRDVELTDGDVVTVRRISMVDTILLADDAPVPVVNQLAEDETKAPEVAVEVMRRNRQKQDETIRRAVVAVNGEPVTIGEDVDLSELFSDDERRRIADTALWLDAEGKD